MSISNHLVRRRLFDPRFNPDINEVTAAHLAKFKAKHSIKRKGIEAVAPLASKVDDILGALERDETVSADSKLMDYIGSVNSGDLQTGDVQAYHNALTDCIQALEAAGIDVGELDDLNDQIGDIAEEMDPGDDERSVKGLTTKKGPATASDRSEARIQEALDRLLSCAEAAAAFWISGDKTEALAAIEDLLTDGKATKGIIASHVDKFDVQDEENEEVDGDETDSESTEEATQESEENNSGAA